MEIGEACQGAGEAVEDDMMLTFELEAAEALAGLARSSSFLGEFERRCCQQVDTDAGAISLSGTRVMNAIFLRELKKKEKAEGSSSVPKKQATPAITINTKNSSCYISKRHNALLLITKKNIDSPSTTLRLTSPVSPARKHNPSPLSPVQQRGNRKLYTTSISSQETSGSESEPPSGPSIHHLYTPDTVIVGRGPNNIAQKLMSQLPSQVDADFINSLGWSDLARRTCSSLTEAMLEEAKMAHAKELKDSKAQSNELLKKKDEEIHQLQEKYVTEIQILKKKLKISELEATQACKDLKDAKTQFMKESSSFKEEFLKSDEFNEICGPKAYRYLETGFEGTVNLFKAHGYPPEEASTNFISLRDVISNLSPNL